MKKRFLGIIDRARAPHPLGGLTTECDIGKAVYEVEDGIIQIENNEQRDSRVARLAQATTRALARVADPPETERC